MNNTNDKFKNVEKEYIDVMQNKLQSLCANTAEAISTMKENFDILLLLLIYLNKYQIDNLELHILFLNHSFFKFYT